MVETTSLLDILSRSDPGLNAARARMCEAKVFEGTLPLWGVATSGAALIRDIGRLAFFAIRVVGNLSYFLTGNTDTEERFEAAVLSCRAMTLSIRLSALNCLTGGLYGCVTVQTPYRLLSRLFQSMDLLVAQQKNNVSINHQLAIINKVMDEVFSLQGQQAFEFRNDKLVQVISLGLLNDFQVRETFAILQKLNLNNLLILSKFS